MSLIKDDPAVAAAERRVKARAEALRVNWQHLKASGRNTLTGGAVIGSLAVAGAVLGARARSPSRRVECKCVKASPSFLRVLLLAAITPLLEGAVARGLGHFADRANRDAADVPPNAPASTESIS
jgi:hypothetical protein